MSVEQNKSSVQRLFDAGIAGWQVDTVMDLLSEDVVMRSPVSIAQGPRSLRTAVEKLQEAFPDLRISLEYMVAEDDRVGARVTLRGTHNGYFAGIVPTGRKLVLPEFWTFQFTAGQITDIEIQFDLKSLTEQLGAKPATEMEP